MKHFKKFFSYLVALTMVLSLATFTGTKVYADTTGTAGSGSAPTTYKLTINNVIKGHTLKMYQVLTGDLSTNEEGKKVLSNAKWGNGVKSITDIDKIKEGDKVSDADMSKLSATNFDPSTSITVYSDDTDSHVYSSNNKKAVKIVGDETSVVFENVKAGYYVVTDSAPNDSESNVKQTTTKSIVQIVGDTAVAEKAGTIQSEKKVEDVNDSTGATTTGQESTNLLGKGELGDSADYDIGDSINYTIEAKLPENYAAYDTFPLTFVDTMSKGLTYNNDAKLHFGKKDTDGIKVSDLTADQYIVGSTENVKYDSNDKETNAKKYSWAITNLKSLATAKGKTLNAGDVVYITYSATLNSEAVVGSEGNPNKMHIEFDSNPYNKTSDTKKTPDDTNIVFTYEAVFNKVDQDGKKPLAGAGFTLNKWSNKENKFVATEKTATVNENGTSFTFSGLDDGIYQLVESKTPAGYNTMKPLEFEIYATHTNDPETLKLSSLTMKKMTKLKDTNDQTLSDDVKGSESDGSMTTNVVNKKGSTLPSTGGMGTTLLYVAGGILVACAAAYVVMSRKHSTNK